MILKHLYPVWVISFLYFPPSKHMKRPCQTPKHLENGIFVLFRLGSQPYLLTYPTAYSVYRRDGFACFLAYSWHSGCMSTAWDALFFLIGLSMSVSGVGYYILKRLTHLDSSIPNGCISCGMRFEVKQHDWWKIRVL